MFRNIGFGAAAALVCGALAVGCSDDGDTVISGGGDARPGAFPGSQVDDSNFAADGRGFTEAGEYFVDGMNTFWNRANGTAIVTYVTEDDNSGQQSLYAAYFNGKSLSRPVNIRGNGNGAIEDETSGVDGMKVLWLNTAGSTNADVAAKNGDALILFTRSDVVLPAGAGVTNEEDSNRRVWLSYFNQSDANAPAAGTVVGGFETHAVVLDTDIVATGGLTDTDIGTFGFVSDGLVRTHGFTSGTDEVDSGDPTTYVYVFYGKDTRGSFAAATSPRFRFVALDLAASTLPAAGGTDLSVGASAYLANEGANIGDEVIVHNNSMIWNSDDVGTENDDVVTVTVFSTAGTGVSTTLNLGEDLVATSADDTEMPDVSNVYGPDHGLDGFYAFTTASGYGGTGGNGSRAGNSDLIASFWPNVATPTREAQEIDAFSGVVDTTDGDTDTIVVRTGANGNVGQVQTRINRSGEFIAVLWTQDSTDLSDLNDGAAGTGAPILNDMLFARAMQTRKTPVGAGTASTRTLANALTGVLTNPAIGTTPVATNDPGDDVFNVDFQTDLADGQGDRACSFQGNHLRINWIYQQFGDQTNATTTGDTLRLLVNGMTVVLGTTDATAPTATLVSTTEVIVDQADDSFLPNNEYSAAAVDAGDASTTGIPAVPTATAGKVLVFFVSQEATSGKADNDTGTGFFTENRLYCWDSPTVVTVSTNPTTAQRDLFQVEEFLGLATVPVNENADSTPTYVGSTLHVFFTEDSSQNGARFDLGTRSYDLSTTAATVAVPLAERFTPETTAEPNFIDNPNGTLLLHGENYAQGGPNTTDSLDGLDDYEEFTILRSGSRVGVFFDENNRIFYQQTSGTADGYYASNGLFRPELVDNESDRTVIDFQIESSNLCNDLPSAMVFIMKEDLDDVSSQESRVQVRIVQ